MSSSQEAGTFTPEQEAFIFSLKQRENRVISQFKNNEHHPRTDALDLLQTPEFLSEYFSQRVYDYLPPVPVVRKSGGTLFTTAGVQQLDEVMHQDASIPRGRMFTFQPVFRTQYIESVQAGSSTSFINPSTLEVNPSPEQHYNSLQNWLNLLSILGYDPNFTSFSTREESPAWAGKEFKAHVIRITYKDVELGDAAYIYNFPQENRPALTISDIGFGLERLRWTVSEAPYENLLGLSDELTSIDLTALDHLRTLTLIAGHGLLPSNKEQGYRFRQLSKRIVDLNKVTREQALAVINSAYEMWSHWISLPEPVSAITERIDKENQRNFNRSILDLLEPVRGQIDLDINIPTSEFYKRLKGTKAKKEDVPLVATRIYYPYTQY